MTTQKASDKPFQVWAVGGVIRSGHNSEAEARSVCEDCNRRAEEMGIKGRYETRPPTA